MLLNSSLLVLILFGEKRLFDFLVRLKYPVDAVKNKHSTNEVSDEFFDIWKTLGGDEK